MLRTMLRASMDGRISSTQSVEQVPRWDRWTVRVLPRHRFDLGEEVMVEESIHVFAFNQGLSGEIGVCAICEAGSGVSFCICLLYGNRFEGTEYCVRPAVRCATLFRWKTGSSVAGLTRSHADGAVRQASPIPDS